MSRTYFLETMGCQMNVHDSERMAGHLERAGFSPAASADAADVIVINTCSVRDKAEEKLFSRLGELRACRTATGGRQVVAVAGCVAQQEGKALLSRAPHVGVVIGTRAQERLVTLCEAALDQGGSHVDTGPHDGMSCPIGLARRSDPVKASITVLEGCNDACAFCVVPFTRGRERMKAKREILAEAHEAAEGGRRELHLLGQIVNHYAAPDEPGCDFAGLLEAVHEVPGIERIRFASPHPRHVSSGFIRTLARLPKVCRHLHLPVQSGSTRILAAMKRRHTREDYLELVSRLRETLPGLALSTDMIVGFPGETERDFEETMTLIRAIGFDSMFSFKYSARPNTLAARVMRDDVPEVEKGRRLTALQSLQRSIQLARHEEAVGTTVEVLLDSVSRRRAHEVSGRTSGNTAVNLPGPETWIGKLAQVRIRWAGANSLWGEAVTVER